MKNVKRAVQLVPVPAVFKEMTSLERSLYDKLKTSSRETDWQIRVTGDQNGDATIRGAFLRWFLLKAIPSARLPILQVEIEGATFEGIINLEATTLDLLLRFTACEFKQQIDLSDAALIGFELLGGSGQKIIADRLTVRGSLRIRVQPGPNPVNAPRLAMLRLCGAEIRGNLDMRGCLLGEEQQEKANSPALFADGLHVQGSVLLSDGFSSFGEIRLNGGTIARNLDCSGATLTNRAGYSLSAAGAHISGSAYFSETREWSTYPLKAQFSSIGTLRLEGAVIDGDLDSPNQPDGTRTGSSSRAISSR